MVSENTRCVNALGEQIRNLFYFFRTRRQYRAYRNLLVTLQTIIEEEMDGLCRESLELVVDDRDNDVLI